MDLGAPAAVVLGAAATAVGRCLPTCEPDLPADGDGAAGGELFEAIWRPEVAEDLGLPAVVLVGAAAVAVGRCWLACEPDLPADCDGVAGPELLEATWRPGVAVDFGLSGAGFLSAPAACII